MKKLVAIVSLFTAGLLFAVPVPSVDCITFSTVGPDTYADGSTVLDGECYALVWSADGEFDGIKADATPVDANDKVVFVAPYAKDGKCQTVVFQIADGFVSGGEFEVFLLDTRRYADGGAVSVGKGADGKLVVNKAVAAASDVKVSRGGSVGAETTSEASVSATAPTSVPEGATAPKIKSIGVEGDYVVVEVEDTNGYLNYALKGGATPSVEGAAGEAKTGNGGTIRLVYPKSGNAGFFKVIRK